MIPSDLYHAFPYAQLLLPVGALLVLLFFRLYFYRRSLLSQKFHPHALNAILVPRSRINFFSKVAALTLAWIGATLALMQPQGNGRYGQEGEKPVGSESKKETEISLKRKAHEVIFLIDASASMSVNDTRTNVSRLDFAKEIVDEIISRLKGESIALYAFTGDTTRLSPATMDYLFVRLILKDLSINEGDIAGTSLTEALSDVKGAFFSKPTSPLKTLILLTDGGDTSLEGLQGDERKKQIEILLGFLKDSQEHNLKVFTIGMGTGEGSQVPDLKYEGKPILSQLDEGLLKAISEKGGGEYYFANSQPANELAALLAAKIGEEASPLEEIKVARGKGEVKGGDDLIYDLYFQIPLGAAIFFLIWALTFPESRVRRK